MRKWTDKQFRDAGWKWVYRDTETGLAIACTVCAADAGEWLRSGENTVVALDHLKERTKADVAAAKARGQKFGRQHYILGYPKRLQEFVRLWVRGDIHKGGDEPLLDHHLTAPQIVAAMHKADPRAPKFSKAQSYTNWKAAEFKGFDRKAADILKIEDVEGDI